MSLSKPALVVSPLTVYQTRRVAAEPGLCLESQEVGSAEALSPGYAKSLSKNQDWGSTIGGQGIATPFARNTFCSRSPQEGGHRAPVLPSPPSPSPGRGPWPPASFIKWVVAATPGVEVGDEDKF